MYHVPLAIVQQRLWSGSVNAQFDLRICWTHGHTRFVIHKSKYNTIRHASKHDNQVDRKLKHTNITITLEDTGLNY